MNMEQTVQCREQSCSIISMHRRGTNFEIRKVPTRIRVKLTPSIDGTPERHFKLKGSHKGITRYANSDYGVGGRIKLANSDYGVVLGMTLNCIRQSHIYCHHYVGH